MELFKWGQQHFYELADDLNKKSKVHTVEVETY